MATIQEDAGFGWGGALPVPSVQELVRNDAKSIPERYIRNLEQGSKPCDTHPVSGEIPILDFSKLVKGDRDEWTRLDVASREWGFFQVVNHGAEGVLPKLRAAMGQFVDLPYAEKKKYGMASNDIQGYGQAYVVSDDQKLDWSDLLALITLPAESRNMKYWPLTIPGFKETVEEHAAEMQRIGDEILMIFSLLMGLEGDFLKRRLGADMKQTLWMNYYPSCSRPDLVLGLSPHSDTPTLTMLVQDDDITALQVMHEGVWVPVKPIPNAIVINIGDVLEAWSNGKYRSVEHRVLTTEKRRISAGTFLVPGDDVLLNPIESMVDDLHPRIFRDGVTFGEYDKYTIARKVDGKSAFIDYLKVENGV